MINVLFIHGFMGSPTGPSYNMILGALDAGKYRLFTFDYDPEDPDGTVAALRDSCRVNGIDVVIGTSLGAFFALTVPDIPRIVHNVCLAPSAVMSSFGATPELTARYIKYEHEIMERARDKGDSSLVSGVFSSEDDLLGSMFLEPFRKCFGECSMVPGGHRMTDEHARFIASVILPRVPLSPERG